ncbi:MAG: lycopene beta-cyclase CrtY [Kofleriaceae bacterium]
MRLEVDYALVGGGLQNGLLALALCAAQPKARLALLERSPALGGNHTWCFHAGDLPAAARPWVEPLLAQRWPGYQVAFPARTRRLSSSYAHIPSARLHEVVAAALRAGPHALLLEHEAVEVEAERVVARPAAGGALVELRAAMVIDARGPDRGAAAGAGYQKFVGLEIDCAAEHGVREPILMDATVPQLDGFRFFYVLPLTERRLLVEDTYFSDTAYLDVAAVRAEVERYCRARGWQVTAVVREECGVLPLPWQGAAPAPTRPLVAGYQGGWFHPVTGYSFPIALRLALAIASAGPGEPNLALRELARRHRRQLAFAHRLNWMLFRWFPPEQRYHVLERFYRLPEDTIRNFYALELTVRDRARMLVGRPPRGLSWRAAVAPYLPRRRAAEDAR